MSCTRRAATPEATKEKDVSLHWQLLNLGATEPPLRCQYTKDAPWHATDVYCPQADEANENFLEATDGQGRQEKLCSRVGNCVHGKWVSETHVLWPRTWVEDRGDLKKTRDGDSKLCRALAICILCKYLSQCVIFFSSQYCKSKQGKRAGKQALGGRGGFSRGP